MYQRFVKDRYRTVKGDDEDIGRVLTRIFQMLIITANQNATRQEVGVSYLIESWVWCVFQSTRE